MDYHLAKRYYDMALDTNTEAYLPVILSLCKLYAKSLWYTLSGGRDKVLTLWGVQNPDESHWYLGKLKDGFAKRWKGRRGSNSQGGNDNTATEARDTPAVLDSDDPVQWAEDQRAAEVERARAEEDAYERGDFFSGDFLAAGDPRRHQRFDENGHMLDDEDEFWETLFLVILCITISALIFVRARLVAQADEARRRHYATQTNANNGGAPINGHAHQRQPEDEDETRATGSNEEQTVSAGGDEQRGQEADNQDGIQDDLGILDARM